MKKFFTANARMKIVYKKNRFSKRIRVTIKRNAEVLVTFPVYVSKRRAEKFVNENMDKINAKIEELSRITKKTECNSRVELITAVIVIECDENAAKISHAEENSLIRIFASPEILSERQTEIEDYVLQIIRQKNKKHLPARTNELAAEFGFAFGKVFIKNAKTRWGSCSKKNNINLNLHLMTLPQRLADYVILHELVHTKVKNHGKDFWRELDKITNGKAKKLDKELNKHKIGV